MADMDKSSILEAVISIGQALSAANCEKAWLKDQEEREKNRCDIGHPVGTKLFSFCYDDGIQEVKVFDEQRLVEHGKIRYCLKTDIFSETVEGAIRAAVESWQSSGELSIEEDIEHFEYDLQYHGERIEWAKIALKILRELKQP